jgi:hypothetical protein
VEILIGGIALLISLISLSINLWERFFSKPKIKAHFSEQGTLWLKKHNDFLFFESVQLELGFINSGPKLGIIDNLRIEIIGKGNLKVELFAFKFYSNIDQPDEGARVGLISVRGFDCNLVRVHFISDPGIEAERRMASFQRADDDEFQIEEDFLITCTWSTINGNNKNEIRSYFSKPGKFPCSDRRQINIRILR